MNTDQWRSYRTQRYVSPTGTIMDVKWEQTSDNGWAIAGNDWTQVNSGVYFPITYAEIVKDGWKKV